MPIFWNDSEPLAKIPADKREQARLIQGATGDIPALYVYNKSVEYVGAVLETRERNGYHDSDFYAIVWDEQSQSIKHIEYATTRFPCENQAHADATPEVRAKAAEYYRIHELLPAILRKMHARLSTVEKGDRVTVSRGRKVPIGTTGEAFWIGESAYGLRVGVRDDAGNVHWTYEKNVDVDQEEKSVRIYQRAKDDLPFLAEERSRKAQLPYTYARASPGFVVV